MAPHSRAKQLSPTGFYAARSTSRALRPTSSGIESLTLCSNPDVSTRFTVAPEQFDEWQSILLAALTDVLRRAASFVQAIEPSEDGHRPINGIAYELAPWFGYIDVCLRDESDRIPDYPRSSDSPGWKYPGILDEIGDSAETLKARELIQEVYEQSQGHNATRTAHLLFIAAAQALLEPEIVTLLKAAGIDAWVLPDYFDILPSRTRLEIGHFDFIVEDPDGTVRGNYCDLVLLDRATRGCISPRDSH